MNGGIALITVIRFRSGGFYSDGMRILQLLRGGPTVERWCAAALLGSGMLSMRPRDVSRALLEQATSISDGTLDDLSARRMAYSITLDQGEPELAGAHLEYVLANLVATRRRFSRRSNSKPPILTRSIAIKRQQRARCWLRLVAAR